MFDKKFKNNTDERKRKELGILWEKDGEKGKYFIGKMHDADGYVNVIVFQNRNRGGKAPDWVIYQSLDGKKDRFSGQDLV